MGSTCLFLNTPKILAKCCIFNFALVKILTFGMLVIDYLASAPNISTNVRLFIWYARGNGICTIRACREKKQSFHPQRENLANHVLILYFSFLIFLVKIYDPFIKMPTYKAIQSIHISQACVSSQYHNGLLKGHYLKWCKKHYFLSLETLHFYSLKNINKIVIRYFSLLSAFTQRYKN